ncbi:unnamed protein product [Effrenium voratum]|nr:unnamed protein product [Effrenium voratum]
MAAWKLAVCVAGIWSCFFVYGILQESIFVYRTPSGEKFKETMVLLIVEHTVSALVALAIMTFFTGSSSSWLAPRGEDSDTSAAGAIWDVKSGR